MVVVVGVAGVGVDTVVVVDVGEVVDADAFEDGVSGLCGMFVCSLGSDILALVSCVYVFIESCRAALRLRACALICRVVSCRVRGPSIKRVFATETHRLNLI